MVPSVERGHRRRPIGDGGDVEVQVVGRGARLDRRLETCRHRLHQREPGRLVGEEQLGQHEPAHQEEQGEHQRQHVAAAPAALEDLAHGHEPDGPPAAHRGPSAADGWGAVTASMNSSESLGGS